VPATAAATPPVVVGAPVLLGAPVAVAVDPVCGMQVAVSAATPQLQIAGERVFFCGVGCRDRYAAEHAGDVPAQSRSSG
jgi:YHS domain-containing protein